MHVSCTDERAHVDMSEGEALYVCTCTIVGGICLLSG